MTRLARHIHHLLLIAAVLVSGCATLSYRERQDQDVIENIRQARSRARANPKNAQAATSYSRSLANAWKNGVFNRCATPGSDQTQPSSPTAGTDEEPHCRAKPEKWTKEALDLLEKTAKVHTAEAPSLYAERGLLLVQAGNTEAAVDEFHRSMELRPNWKAATVLIGYYSGQNDYDRVKRICSRTVPHIRDQNRKYTFIKRCVNDSGAATQRGALSWATAQQREFYLSEKRRRQRAQQRRERRQQQQQREQKKCKITCKERGHLCLRNCHTDDCEAECNHAYQACLKRCEL